MTNIKEEFQQKLSSLFKEYKAELTVEEKTFGFYQLSYDMEIYIPPVWEGIEFIRDSAQINLGNSFCGDF